jgi:hypothetical protein
MFPRKKKSINHFYFFTTFAFKKFSASKSAPLTISTTNVIGRLVDPPTRTTINTIILSDEQFGSIQDLCEEF